MMEKMSEREMLEYGESWAYTAEGIIGTLEVALDKIEEGMAEQKEPDAQFAYKTMVHGLRNAITLCETCTQIPQTVMLCQLARKGDEKAKRALFENEARARIAVRNLGWEHL